MSTGKKVALELVVGLILLVIVIKALPALILGGIGYVAYKKRWKKLGVTFMVIGALAFVGSLLPKDE